ncbi:glutathione peroxidase [Paracoccus spongiarum]|uniref:Glutathione peroxidase n=1 Tax=Paracoccus spongiarum TaxID=3064387 RepID=A0ABT9JD50_9RHOB|nr:glutathione peroxidase [Paracoccus sp. 2205BS29-5]MDP5307761.1 glutathione peroxidase [Paracoccus sp. 2205BS29-5]
MHRRLFLSLATLVPAALAGLAPRRGRAAGPAPAFTFPSIDGGSLNTADWRGRPVLVVNTASMCGFAGQLRDMQALHEEFGPRGLVVLAVPSDDFNQELADAAKVKEYCTLEYGITLPMTDILPVARGQVHPFYAWVRQQTGFVPKWNFNKVLLGPEGQILGSWGSFANPGGRAIRAAFTPYLTA